MRAMVSEVPRMQGRVAVVVYELVEVSFVYQVKRVTSWAAFYLTSIQYKLGCILPYKQAIVVSQT